jgi:hypothetical protein
MVNRMVSHATVSIYTKVVAPMVWTYNAWYMHIRQSKLGLSIFVYSSPKTSKFLCDIFYKK